jgi:CheY-like chemotaxis protein
MKPLVLVVEDHAASVELLVEELQSAGYDASGTTSQNEALSLAIRTKPDVVVLDVGMRRDLDGYELAGLLRSYAATRGIRLIAISAEALDQRPERVPLGGWNAFLWKPLRPGTLPALVRTVLAAPITTVQRTGPMAIPTPPEGFSSKKAGDRED